MKVAIIYNKDFTGVINQFGRQNKEVYNPQTVKRIAEALEKGGHNVLILDGNMHVIEQLQEFMPKVIEGERLGMVFNMAYGIQGESRYTHLPAMLEMLGIPYVGSGPSGHAVALDKVITKVILQKSGIPTPYFWVFSSQDEDMSDVTFPAIVKPKMEAVSFGLKVVNNERDLRIAVQHILDEFQQQALVEQFIRGREFCVGLLGNGYPEAFPVLEIDLENDPDAIQTESDKRKKPRSKICPAQISKELSGKMIALSKQAFKTIGLKDFARVDIRMDRNECIYLLEINSMASLGLTGSYVHAANIAGYDYNKLVNKMLDVAAVRYFSEAYYAQQDRPATKPVMSLPVRVRGFLRSNADKTQSLLAEMVNTNSYTRDVEGVNALGSRVARQLKLLGFTGQTFPQVEIGNILFFSNSRDDIDVLLLGHLDSAAPFTKHVSFRETTHKLYGTAIWNCKAGLALMITALRALRFFRLLRKIKIGILLTTDSSLQSRISRTTIEDIAGNAKYVIGLSGASVNGAVVTSRSGAAVYHCEMNVENADSADAIAEASVCFSDLLASLVKLSNNKENILLTVRELHMRSSVPNLFAHGEATLSVRFDDEQQAIRTERKIKRLVRKTKCRTCRFQVSGGVRRPPMKRTQEVKVLYAHLNDICKDLDIRILEEHRWSSADICFVKPSTPRIDGMGAVGDAPHDDEEYILRHSLTDRALVLVLLLKAIAYETA